MTVPGLFSTGTPPTRDTYRPLRMSNPPLRWLCSLSCFLAAYVLMCMAAGVIVASGALHPGRRLVEPAALSTLRQTARSLDASLEDAEITTADGVRLRGWSLLPSAANGDAVILLHGLGDNRMGMIGYAEILLRHGYAVLMPDARAHGESGGELATYGLLERQDIRRWFDWLTAREHPGCIFGLGESMGAAQLLQALQTEPHFCAVVAESSFCNFREIAYDRVGQFFHTGPWLGRSVLRPVVKFAFLYSRWKYGLNMSEVSPENAVAGTSVPVFLIHGEVDSNIPVRHSRRIAARNPAVVLWEVPQANHCGAISVAGEKFTVRLIAWLADHDRSAKHAIQSRTAASVRECLKVP